MEGISEWEIENFSCWSNDFHGDVLNLISSHLLLIKQVYPRGVDGKGEHLVVRIHKSFIHRESLLTFLGSDGSVICSRQHAEDSDEDWINFKGPKFDEIVAGVRRNEPVHKDRLTLRWNTADGRMNGRLRTVIDATSGYFQIKPDIFDLKYSYWSTEIYTELQNGVHRRIFVKACKTGSTSKDTKVKFTLKSCIESKFISRTSIWMAKGNSIIQKYEDCRIVDNTEEHVIFPDSPFEELFEKGFQTIMRCKIISDRLKFYRYYSDFILPADFSSLSAGNCYFLLKPALKPDNAVSVLSKDLQCLYKDLELADFEMRCGTVSFPTHKNILSARSPVLKAMLSGDMREAACGHMEVEDLDPHTLGRFLSFLYSGATGEEPLQWEEASKLYYAADKYQVPSLKEICAAVLQDSVTLENVCDILSIADKHQDEGLRSVSHKFILENYNEVLESENWKTFLMSDPILVAKTLTSFSNKLALKSNSMLTSLECK